MPLPPLRRLVLLLRFLSHPGDAAPAIIPLFLLLSAAAVIAGPAAAQSAPQPAQLPDPEQADVAVQAYVYEPAKLEPTEHTARLLRVPKGFQVTVFARGLGRARMLAAAGDGSVYVYVADLAPDGSVGELKRIIADLPDAGQHANRTLAVGPDRMLYLSVGSTCNACEETSPESAALLRSTLDGRSRTVYPSGLRNTIGFGWHPRTGELWGMDHGIDWLGNADQREELNRREQGKQYGWPYIYDEGKQNPQDDPPGDLTMAQWDSISQRPALTYTATLPRCRWPFTTGRCFPRGIEAMRS
ncbi:MAG: PQQ-dependent sugar dehydrogenase [Gemmatimonadales bacterium]